MVIQIDIDKQRDCQSLNAEIKIVPRPYTNQTFYFYRNTDPYYGSKNCGMVLYCRLPVWGPFPEFDWVRQAYFDDDPMPF